MEITMLKICFVCHGNICRSPMAEFLFRKMVEESGRGGEFEIASKATSSEEISCGRGNPVYPPVREILEKEGIDCRKKRASLLQREDYDKYDYLIGMDERNRQNMLRIFGGDPDNKIRLLLSFTDHPGDVADPWYTRDFQKCHEDILDGCEGLLREFGR